MLHVVDNQWAISTHRSLATGGSTFALRAEAYGLPGLRVDGNDFLAVYAAEAWAIERAAAAAAPRSSSCSPIAATPIRPATTPANTGPTMKPPAGPAATRSTGSSGI